MQNDEAHSSSVIRRVGGGFRLNRLTRVRMVAAAYFFP